jgi:hypothetical protein
MRILALLAYFATWLYGHPDEDASWTGQRREEWGI